MLSFRCAVLSLHLVNLSNLKIVVSDRFVIVNQCSIYKEPDIERTFLLTNKVGFDWSFAFLAIFVFVCQKETRPKAV